ncbi:MAG: addiction module antidote protein [Pseudomonadota bacterium]
MPKGYSKWDIADYLKTEEEIDAFLQAVFEEDGDDPAFIAKSLAAVARARGMTKVAKKAGISRSALYNSLSEKGNPEFATVLKIVNALGLKLRLA